MQELWQRRLSSPTDTEAGADDVAADADEGTGPATGICGAAEGVSIAVDSASGEGTVNPCPALAAGAEPRGDSFADAAATTSRTPASGDCALCCSAASACAIRTADDCGSERLSPAASTPSPTEAPASALSGCAPEPSAADGTTGGVEASCAARGFTAGAAATAPAAMSDLAASDAGLSDAGPSDAVDSPSPDCSSDPSTPCRP